MDGINDYTCNCFPGYQGKNCDEDVAECAAQPCQFGGLCFEKSDLSLYDPSALSSLPLNVRQTFNRAFSYEDAAGYVCSCLEGYEGVNCEIDIDECMSNPCLRGDCINGIAKYTCECPPGYNGTNCELYINECVANNQPCQNGACIGKNKSFL